MCLLKYFFLCLFVFSGSGFCEDVKNSPAYGYHLRVGVPAAQRLLVSELLNFRGHSAQRIIGGTKATAIVPYQAGIIARLRTGGDSICGGALVSTTRILTAAHCWFDGEMQAAQFTIVLGSLTIFTGGTRITTSDVTMHPSWNYFLNDIAVVKISVVRLSNTIQLIPLPTAADANQNFAGSEGHVAVFGKTRDAQTAFPQDTALQQITLPIITNAVCQTSYKKITLHASHLCTSGAGAKGTCDGDSGGPLTVMHNNKRILAGIVSFGPEEGCQANIPSVFTRVTSFLTWINSML